VPGSKIVVGVPLYGRSCLGTDGIRQGLTGHFGGGDGVIEYMDLSRAGFVEHVDRNVGAAFSLGGDAGFVGYDVPETVTARMQFVKRMGLKGLVYWTGVADAPSELAIEVSFVLGGQSCIDEQLSRMLMVDVGTQVEILI